MEDDKTLKAFTELKVSVIDIDKLSAQIDKEIKEQIALAGTSTFAPKLEEGESFYVQNFAIAKSATGKFIITDNECIHNVIGDDGLIELDVRSHTKDAEGHVKTFSVFPKYTTKVNVNDALENCTEIPMVEFMKGRFRYNPRIENNMRIFLKSMKE